MASFADELTDIFNKATQARRKAAEEAISSWKAYETSTLDECILPFFKRKCQEAAADEEDGEEFDVGLVLRSKIPSDGFGTVLWARTNPPISSRAWWFGSSNRELRLAAGKGGTKWPDARDRA